MAGVVVAGLSATRVHVTFLKLDLIVLHFLKLVGAHAEAQSIHIAAVELVRLPVQKLSPEVPLVLLTHSLPAQLGLRVARVVFSFTRLVVLLKAIQLRLSLLIPLFRLAVLVDDWDVLSLLEGCDFVGVLI